METVIDSFKKTINLEEVDKVLVIPLMAGWTARFSGIPLETIIHDPESMVKAQIAAQETIGHDSLYAGVDPLFIPEAFGCAIGALSSGELNPTPLCIENPEDVDGLPVPDVRKDGRFPTMLKAAEGLVSLPNRKLPVLSGLEGPFTTCARMIGTEKLMRAVMKNKPLVEKLLQTVEQTMSRYGRALEEVGVDALFVADPVGSSTMVSPKIYRELVFPTLQRFIAGLTIPVILHVCGNTHPIVEIMAETDASILSFDQCMDLARAKQQVAGHCGIGGNVDPINALLYGTVEDVKTDTLRCLRDGGNKGFILMTGCAVPPDTSVENLRAMVQTVKDAEVGR